MTDDQCLSVEDLAAFADGNVWPNDRPRIEGHLARCSECRKIIAFVVRSKESIPDPIPAKRSEA